MNTTHENTVDLASIAANAEAVAAEAAQADEARGKLKAAQAELFEKVIATARPALRAIGTRPCISFEMRHHADVNYCGGVDTRERYPARAVCLTDPKPWPTEDTPRANEGAYSGEDLFVREDGALFALRYSGSWSRWQGSSWGWTAEITEYGTTTEAIADGWNKVDTYIETIAEALEKAKGTREASTKKALERAERIAAVVSLIGKGARS